MPDQGKEWAGQVVDRQFRLDEYVGATDHSAVFLTRAEAAEPRKAILKLISAKSAEAERQFADWARASKLKHPNLLKLYQWGKCRLGEMDLLYVVMEHAEEDLSQVLPQRALTADETREAMKQVSQAVAHLAAEGLAHTHIKPSNILAIGDQLKISADTISALGEAQTLRRETDAYDAPEIAAVSGGAVTEAAAMWGMGATILAALTQAVPELGEAGADPKLPATLPQPFDEIVRETLRRDPVRRWSARQVALRLDPSAVLPSLPAAAKPKEAVASPAKVKVQVMKAAAVPVRAPAKTAEISPLSVPLSQEPAVPLAKLPVAAARTETRGGQRREEVAIPSYVLPLLLVGVLVVAGILMLPRMFHKSSPGAPAKITAPAQATQPPAAPEQATKPTEVPAKPTPATSVAEAAPVAEAKAKPAVERVAASEVTKGEVLGQVLPKVPDKALATIQGRVRISVRANVDTAGQVESAQAETPGASKYFTGLAEKAAQQWTFTTPQADGKSVASEWLIHFDFTTGGVTAKAEQAKP